MCSVNDIQQMQKMCNWINTNDVFWLHDFKKAFNVTDYPKSDNYNSYVNLINQLKKTKAIQCCENKGSHKQYILVEKINFLELMKYKISCPLAVIHSDYECLVSDGEDDVLFCGTNICNQTIIGSVLCENEGFVTTFLHSVVAPTALSLLKSGQITYLYVLQNAKTIYEVESTADIWLSAKKINFEDIKKDYLPTNDSYLNQ